MWDRFKPDKSASSSCEMFKAFLASRTLPPNLTDKFTLSFLGLDSFIHNQFIDIKTDWTLGKSSFYA
jgi:hypothetical protein